MGFKSEPTVLCEASNDRAVSKRKWLPIFDHVISQKVRDGADDAASKVAFVAELVRGVDVSWSGQLLDNGDTLALHVPNGALPDGSKEM